LQRLDDILVKYRLMWADWCFKWRDHRLPGEEVEGHETLRIRINIFY